MVDRVDPTFICTGKLPAYLRIIPDLSLCVRSLNNKQKHVHPPRIERAYILVRINVHGIRLWTSASVFNMTNAGMVSIRGYQVVETFKPQRENNDDDDDDHDADD